MASSCSAPGSSPRGWGKLPLGGFQLLCARFIPTRVGKAPTANVGKKVCPVHPHAGGESIYVFSIRRRCLGSSPRGWGKPEDLRFAGLMARFIPTRVGKAGWSQMVMSSDPVHPHAGGESKSDFCEEVELDGSSPRGWGKRNTPHDPMPYLRFIPTRVGKAMLGMTERACDAVHPHAGGESVQPNIPEWVITGSSPRGWGKHAFWCPPKLFSRFIPTRVGKAQPGGG